MPGVRIIRSGICENGLSEEISDLQEKLRAAQAKIIEYQNKLSDYATGLQSEESVGLHLAVVEKQN